MFVDVSDDVWTTQTCDPRGSGYDLAGINFGMAG